MYKPNTVYKVNRQSVWSKQCIHLLIACVFAAYTVTPTHENKSHIQGLYWCVTCFRSEHSLSGVLRSGVFWAYYNNVHTFVYTVELVIKATFLYRDHLS